MYYTYAYLREDGTPYYIGKGKGRRATSRNKNDIHLGNNKLLILKRFDSEFDSYKHEMYMISIFRRKDLGTGILLNKTNGGDGAGGRIITDKLMNIHKETGARCVKEKIGMWGYSKEEMDKNRMKGSMASQKSCAKSFVCKDKDGNIVRGHNITEFCRQQGISAGNFNSMLNGRQKSAYGYTRLS